MEVLCLKGHWHQDVESATKCGPSHIVSKAMPKSGEFKTKDIHVLVMAEQNVVISKEYGPLVACDVRVRLDIQKAEWVVEREEQTKDDTESFKTSWEEMARFDCQESLHFEDEEDSRAEE